MKVATYNIRHGAPEGGWARAERMARAVASLDADVVALQEVDRRVFRSWFVNQTDRAARASGAVGLFSPARSIGPGGRYGNALLVRGTVERVSHVPLRSAGEPRVAVIARVGLDRFRDRASGDVTELTAVSTHLQNRRDGRPDEAPAQLEQLLDELSAWPDPWVLMGDFNLRPERVLPILGAAGLLAVESVPTFPASAPRLRLDWIALRGLEVRSVQVPALSTSDHRPIVADVARRDVDPPAPG
ncbi:endonuclease/exonuclease/phosphatase family protein [soil metagenome]